jgi:hypothetical protein
MFLAKCVLPIPIARRPVQIACVIQAIRASRHHLAQAALHAEQASTKIPLGTTLAKAAQLESTHQAKLQHLQLLVYCVQLASTQIQLEHCLLQLAWIALRASTRLVQEPRRIGPATRVQ